MRKYDWVNQTWKKDCWDEEWPSYKEPTLSSLEERIEELEENVGRIMSLLKEASKL